MISCPLSMNLQKPNTFLLYKTCSYIWTDWSHIFSSQLLKRCPSFYVSFKNNCILVNKYILPSQINLMFTYKLCNLIFIVVPHIVCIGVSNPPQKQPPLSCQTPPLNLQTVQAPPFLDNPPPPSLYWFFVKPPSKSPIFQWTPKTFKVFHP